MPTLSEVISAHGIKIRAIPGAPVDPTFKDADGWTCTLTRKGSRRRMTVPFYMGTGHNGKAPTAFDVLYCLRSDASGADNARSFED